MQIDGAALAFKDHREGRQVMSPGGAAGDRCVLRGCRVYTELVTRTGLGPARWVKVEFGEFAFIFKCKFAQTKYNFGDISRWSPVN